MAGFGQLIKEFREKRGMTVRNLAEAISKSPGYVSRIEVRGEIPSIELVLELAKALRGNVEDFLESAKQDSIDKATIEVESKYQDAIVLYRKGKKDA